MEEDSAHKSNWKIAEVVFGIPFLAAIVLQVAVPLSMSPGLLRSALGFGGIVLMIIGIAFIALARRAFAQFNQPTDPGHPTTKIVTTGVFAVSRNPIYLGAVCLLAGVGLAINWLWILVFLLPSLVACHYVLIVPEEKYLAARFGGEYHKYTSTVRRWIGRNHLSR